jgi:diguanylate cyclase (GGDEF)-like protein
MSRASIFRVGQIAVLFLAVALAVSAVFTMQARETEYALFLAALIFLAMFLRIEAGDVSVGFEAAIVFSALIIFHTPTIAFVAVVTGGMAYAAYRAAASKQWELERFYATAQLAISYAVVGLLYALAVAPDAKPMAKVAGYILLLIGYVVTALGFNLTRRYIEETAAPMDLRTVLLAQGRTLLLVSPIVAIAVMLFRSYGATGFAFATLPLLVLAYSMRNEADLGEQNVELVRRNRELAILTESSTQILSAEGDQETLGRLTDLLSKLAKMKACAVVTWEANPDVPGAVYRFGDCRRTDHEVLRWVESAGFSQSAPSRAFVFQSGMRRFPLSSGEATQVLIGIQTAEVIYGILIYETEDLSIVKAASMNLLTLLVNQTALSLQDQLLRREMREKTVQLESNAATMTTILDVSNSLIGQFEIDAALTRIAQAIRKALGFEVVVFALFDARKDEFVRRAQAGLDDVWDEVRKKHVSSAEITPFFNQEFRVSNSFFVSHTALRQSEHDFFVRPEDMDDGFLKPDEWHENDLLLVPLMSGEQMIGYLSVRDPHDRKVPAFDRVQTLEVFATQAVTALQSARQYDEIKRLTFIDALTPAYNHRFFQEALGKEIHRHSRNGHELALAMLDIDNFKRINDSFGHPVGDEILKGLVEELMRNARDSDVVARYGGEEFAIIFPDTPAQSASDAANRFRELVERREFPLPHLGRNLRITISVGVAVYPHDGLTSADLISRADSALYYAKKHGKNQVAIAAELSSADVAGY